MVILHTADWHLGKKLGRFERFDEFARFSDELVGICRERQVDLVLIAGDVFDSPSPSNRALRAATATLKEITGTGAKVVAVAGNHDSPDYFENLHRFSELHGVHLAGRLQRPEEGGVRVISTRSGPAAVACCPFVRENVVVDFASDSSQRYRSYQQKVGRILAAFDTELANHPDCVRLLVAHLATDGAVLSIRNPSGAQRGERALTIGNAYVLDAQQMPTTSQYNALGHIHAGQPVLAAAPTRYSGSPLALDFGESEDRKQVVIVEAEPDRSARIEPIDLATPGFKRLRQISGTWERIRSRQAEVGDDYVALTVSSYESGPAVFQRAAEIFPFLVRAREESTAPESEGSELRLEDDWNDLFSSYFAQATGKAAPEHLLAEFHSIYAAAINAPD